ncbi:hypothetical protein F0562_011781 [Nyssa sinensis]|uniref:Uncharacterized protein n=1 Tax=Nyssa sinensis TaxID=561372 RepID=A0A5J4ZVB3_9ASTE|nr:hypothetical protein F0562_011781 [Nyssa sinensis]
MAGNSPEARCCEAEECSHTARETEEMGDDEGKPSDQMQADFSELTSKATRHLQSYAEGEGSDAGDPGMGYLTGQEKEPLLYTPLAVVATREESWQENCRMTTAGSQDIEVYDKKGDQDG